LLRDRSVATYKGHYRGGWTQHFVQHYVVSRIIMVEMRKHSALFGRIVVDWNWKILEAGAALVMLMEEELHAEQLKFKLGQSHYQCPSFPWLMKNTLIHYSCMTLVLFNCL
jgi:hypothetical protein